MLIIRKAQMVQLESVIKVDFRSRVSLALSRLQLPPEFSDPSVMDNFIDNGIAAALRFGLGSEAEVYRFLSIVYTRLPGRDPANLTRAAQNCLTSYGVTAFERLDQLDQLLANASMPNHG